MKNQTSIFISLIITLVITGLCSFSAFAETITKYWEPRPNAQSSLGYVNDKPAEGIYIEADTETGGTKITYNGNGKLTGWEFPLLEKGKDYEIIFQKGNSITIKLINENHELPYINALVDLPETASSTETTKSNNQNESTKATTTEITKTTVSSTVENITSSTTNEVITSTTAAETSTEDNIKTSSQNKIILPITAACIISAVVVGFVLLKKYKK